MSYGCSRTFQGHRPSHIRCKMVIARKCCQPCATTYRTLYCIIVYSISNNVTSDNLQWPSRSASYWNLFKNVIFVQSRSSWQDFEGRRTSRGPSFMTQSLVGSRLSDHYFRSVCFSVCLFVCAEFFSAVFDPIWIKLGRMLHVRV